MNTLARLGAAAGTAVLALGLVAPAHAATWSYNDRSSDVAVETCDETTEECTPKATTTTAQGDIVRSVVEHRSRKVVLRTKYRDLARGDWNSLYWGRVETNEGLKRQVGIFIDPDGTRTTRLFRPNGNPVRCSVGTTVSYADNVIELRIPRSCLSGPRWVRAGQSFWRIAEGTGDAANTTVWWGDDGQSASPNDTPVLSPRVRRG